MPHHAIHAIKATPRGAEANEAQRTLALGQLVLCWLLAGGAFVVTFYLQAFFTTILAYFFLGEQLHLYHVAGIAFIASGIAIVMLAKQKVPDQSTTPRS